MAKPDVLLDLARKMSSDPAIQRQIAEAFFRLTTSNPALGRRLLAGDPQAVMEAYQTLIRNNGNIPMPSGPPRIGASPIGPGQTVGGVSGPGVPVTPGTGLIPAPPRGLPNDPSATRQLTTTGGDAPDALDSAAREITVIDATPSTGLIPADAGALAPSGRRGPGVRVGGVGGPPTRYGTRGVPAVPDAPPPRGGLPAWAVPAAAAAYGTAVGIGAYNSVNRDGPVADDLDAAATEIAPDAEMKSANPAGFAPDTSDLRRKLPGETMAQYAARVAREMGADTDEALRAAEERAAARNAGYRDALRRQADAEVRAKGSPANYADTGLHTDYRSPYGPMTNFAEGATVTVDGVQVPGFDLGDGRLRYRLGDVKAAQEAAHNAKLDAMFSQSAQEDLAAYGSQKTHEYVRDDKGQLTKDPKTGRWAVRPIATTELVDAQGRPSPEREAQQNRVIDRKKVEDAQYSQNAGLRNRPGLRALEAAEAERAGRFSDMARLAGGSQGLRGGAGGNIGMFQALAMLEGVDPTNMDARQQAIAQNIPMDPVRAQVEGRRWDMAGRLAGDVVTGMLAGQGQSGVQQQALDMRNVENAQNYFDLWHTQNVGPFAGPYTREKRDRMVRYLMLRYRIDQPTAEAIADTKPHTVSAPASPPLVETDAGAMPQMSL